MVSKGHPHVKAVCGVVPHLLDRVFCVLKENRQYYLRDQHDIPVNKREAREIVSTEFTVPEAVRRRLRRNNKPREEEMKKEANRVRDEAKRPLPKKPPSNKNCNSRDDFPSMGPEHIGSILSREMAYMLRNCG